MKPVALFMITMLIAAQGFAGDSPFNYGESWESFSMRERQMYVIGFTSGINQAANDVVVNLAAESSLRKEISETIAFPEIDNIVLVNTISSLYKQPENSYIHFGKMIVIARDKITGKSIGKKLMNARKAALK